MARIPSNADLGLAETVRRTVLQKQGNARYVRMSTLMAGELAKHEVRHKARMTAILANSPRPPLTPSPA